MAYSRAVQLIEAADACTKISTIVEVLPTKESHVRELLKLGCEVEPVKLFLTGSPMPLVANWVCPKLLHFRNYFRKCCTLVAIAVCSQRVAIASNQRRRFQGSRLLPIGRRYAVFPVYFEYTTTHYCTRNADLILWVLSGKSAIKSLPKHAIPKLEVVGSNPITRSSNGACRFLPQLPRHGASVEAIVGGNCLVRISHVLNPRRKLRNHLGPDQFDGTKCMR